MLKYVTAQCGIAAARRVFMIAAELLYQIIPDCDLQKKRGIIHGIQTA